MSEPSSQDANQPPLVSSILYLLRELLQKVLDRAGVAAYVLAGLVTVLEEEEGRHGADAKLLGELGKVLDVELGKVHLVLELRGFGPPILQGSSGLAHILTVYGYSSCWVLGNVLGNDGSNGFARTAPRREGVEKHDGFPGDDLLELAHATAAKSVSLCLHIARDGRGSEGAPKGFVERTSQCCGSSFWKSLW